MTAGSNGSAASWSRCGAASSARSRRRRARVAGSGGRRLAARCRAADRRLGRVGVRGRPGHGVGPRDIGRRLRCDRRHRRSGRLPAPAAGWRAAGVARSGAGGAEPPVAVAARSGAGLAGPLDPAAGAGAARASAGRAPSCARIGACGRRQRPRAAGARGLRRDAVAVAAKGAGQIAQIARHLGDRLDHQPAAMVEIRPAGIDPGDRRERQHQDRRLGQPALGQRRADAQARPVGQVGDRRLDLGDQVVAVEAQIVGIAAQEPERIGPPRQRRQIALLDPEQIGRPDPQMLRDLVQILAALEPDLAQLGADLAHQGRRRDRAGRDRHSSNRASGARPQPGWRSGIGPS